MNKKAMEIGLLVTILAVIISFFLIFVTVTRAFAGAEEKQAETLCQDSVALRSITALQIGTESSAGLKAVPLLCKTIDKKISGTKEAVLKTFAEKMARCWQMFGEGRYDTNIFAGTNILGSESQCFMCYTLIVEESSDFTGKDSISGEEFANFLRTQPYPHRKDFNYLDYFQYGGGNGFVLGIFTEEGIKPNHAYAIAYKARSEECGWCSYFLGGGAGAATLGGLSILVFGVGTGGLALVAGGAVVVTAGGLGAFLREQGNADSIMVVDMNQQTLRDAFTAQCTQVTDIAGR